MMYYINIYSFGYVESLFLIADDITMMWKYRIDIVEWDIKIDIIAWENGIYVDFGERLLWNIGCHILKMK